MVATPSWRQVVNAARQHVNQWNELAPKAKNIGDLNRPDGQVRLIRIEEKRWIHRAVADFTVVASCLEDESTVEVFSIPESNSEVNCSAGIVDATLFEKEGLCELPEWPKMPAG